MCLVFHGNKPYSPKTNFPSNIADVQQKHKYFIFDFGRKNYMPNPFSNWSGPQTTPKPLKFLLGAIAAITLASALLPGLHLPLFLGLSFPGIDHHFYWQWLTYLFIQPPLGGINLTLLIQLGFTLYLGWIFGTSLLDRLGYPKLTALFIGTALSGGLAAWAALLSVGSSQLFIGPTAPLYGLLFAWTLLNAEAEILLFFTIPLKARFALFVLMGSTLLIDLSQAQWTSVASLLASVSYSYLYTLLACRIRSPFTPLHGFERALIRTWERCRTWSRKKAAPYQPTKVYDIKSGLPVLDDDQFMDAMLAKISLYGEDSLSSDDRKRMTQISQRKALRK
jgi:membrane associated rhomboid family serine protease